MWGEHQGMGWWMLLGSIWFVVFWGILIWFVFQLVDRRVAHRHTEDKALEVLRQRYARGEITREQFEEMQDHLRR